MKPAGCPSRETNTLPRSSRANGVGTGSTVGTVGTRTSMSARIRMHGPSPSVPLMYAVMPVPCSSLWVRCDVIRRAHFSRNMASRGCRNERTCLVGYERGGVVVHPCPPPSVTLRAHSWYEHALLLSHWPCVRDVTWCCSFEAGRRTPQPGCYAFNPINGFQLREDVLPCTFLLERELRMRMQVPPDFFELRCEGHDIFVNSDGILSQKDCMGDANNVISQTTVDA